MYEFTSGSRGCARDAASLIFNLPGYRVIDAVDLPLGGRRVRVQAESGQGSCPDCGVASARVHAWVQQRVKDIPAGGELVQVVVRKPRLVCQQPDCSRVTFTQVSEQLPTRARCLSRLRGEVADAVIGSGRSVHEVAGAFALSWSTVQAAGSAVAAVSLPDVDAMAVRHLGVDEHRFAHVRFFRDESGRWHRVEPWMPTFVNADTGQVLGVIDGRTSAGVTDWLTARSPAWRARVQVVAIDPSAAFRSAIRTCLPDAEISVDHWHLVRLANLMLTRVRQRVAREQLGHRGRKDDLVWAHRMLLLRAGDHLSARAAHRLEQVFAQDDPTGEIQAAWNVKEALRAVLASSDLDTAQTARQRLRDYVYAADMPETSRLLDTINTWWKPIEVFITTGVTNARTEAANTMVKHIKRTGRGYRNPQNYQTRILLRSAHQTRRRRRLTQQGTTVNRE
jgi:transposase